jgi:hypothetical protein
MDAKSTVLFMYYILKSNDARCFLNVGHLHTGYENIIGSNIRVNGNWVIFIHWHTWLLQAFYQLNNARFVFRSEHYINAVITYNS